MLIVVFWQLYFEYKYIYIYKNVIVTAAIFQLCQNVRHIKLHVFGVWILWWYFGDNFHDNIENANPNGRLCTFQVSRAHIGQPKKKLVTTMIINSFNLFCTGRMISRFQSIVQLTIRAERVSVEMTNFFCTFGPSTSGLAILYFFYDCVFRLFVCGSCVCVCVAQINLSESITFYLF